MAKKKKQTFLMYADVINYIDGLTDHQIAELYKATLCYANDMPVEIDDAEVRGIWRVIKSKMDENNAAYTEQCDRNKENAERKYQEKATESCDTVRGAATVCDTVRGAATVCDTVRGATTVCDRIHDTDNDTDNDTDILKEKVLSKESTKKKTATRFSPPSPDEVKNYCLERHSTVNPDAFIAFYESNGWKVGKNSMKDWKAAVRTWEQRETRAAPEPFDTDAWAKDIAEKRERGESIIPVNEEVVRMLMARREVDEHDGTAIWTDRQHAASVS